MLHYYYLLVQYSFIFLLVVSIYPVSFLWRVCLIVIFYLGSFMYLIIYVCFTGLICFMIICWVLVFNSSIRRNSCFIACYLNFIHCSHCFDCHCCCHCHCHCHCHFLDCHLLDAGFSYFVCSIFCLVFLFITWVCNLWSQLWLLLVVALICTDNLGSSLSCQCNFWLQDLFLFNLLSLVSLISFRIPMSTGKFMTMSVLLWLLGTFLTVV